MLRQLIDRKPTNPAFQPLPATCKPRRLSASLALIGAAVSLGSSLILPVSRSASAAVSLTGKALNASAPLGALPFTHPVLVSPEIGGPLVHRVVPGDTLWGLAHTYGLTAHHLAAYNHTSLQAPLLVGEVLRIPGSVVPVLGSIRPGTNVAMVGNVPGVLSPRTERYRVRPGDTLAGIAAANGDSVSVLAAVNHLSNPNLLWVNQTLRIPVGVGQLRTDTSPAAVSRTVVAVVPGSPGSMTEADNPPLVAAALSPGHFNPILQPLVGKTVSPQLPPLPSADRYLPHSSVFNGYIWPTKGVITSAFGWRPNPMGPGEEFHKGIDIGAPMGTPIVAAASGVVVSAGWNPGGYGNVVEIRHPNGSLTLYAHASRVLVRAGERVDQGQEIAEMGSTGYSTGPHCHFEIHPPGEGAVNPLAYLPRVPA